MFFVFAIGLSFGVAKSALACDPLGCLLGGKDQDILALVTITAVDGEIATVTSEHFYDQSQIKPSGSFTIDFTGGTPWFPLTPEVGKHYFVSLACEENNCVPKWGTWEVDNVDYQQARLLEIRNGDDAAIQWFVQGNKPDFFGDEGKTYVRTPGGVLEIFPEYKIAPGSYQIVRTEDRSDWFKLIYILSFGLVFFGSIFLVWRKNKTK